MEPEQLIGWEEYRGKSKRKKSKQANKTWRILIFKLGKSQN